MSGPPGHDDHGGGGGHGAGWVITFADLMALLMALFVMIVSFSNQDERKLHDAMGSMKDAFGLQPVYRPAGIIERQGLPPRTHPATAGNNPPDDRTQFATLADTRFEAAGPEADTHRFESDAADPDARFLSAAASLRQALQDLPDFAELSRQVAVSEQPDGIHIALLDQDGRAMFVAGSRDPLPRVTALLGRIAPVLDAMPGPIKVIGHTAAERHPGSPGDDHWQLAVDRATSVAHLLGRYGLGADKVAEISGKATADPIFGDPYLSANRRIEIILLAAPPPLPLKGFL